MAVVGNAAPLRTKWCPHDATHYYSPPGTDRVSGYAAVVSVCCRYFGPGETGGCGKDAKELGVDRVTAERVQMYSGRARIVRMRGLDEQYTPGVKCCCREIDEMCKICRL